MKSKAIQLCEDSAFQEWVINNAGISKSEFQKRGFTPIEVCALYIKQFCGVSHIDHIEDDPQAAMVLTGIINHFNEWRKENKDG